MTLPRNDIKKRQCRFQLDIVVAEDIFPVMVKDGLVTSHPVSPKLNHPDEIAESFDQISYNKVNKMCNGLKL